MGINGAAHKWFENYLKGRTQKVDINGNLSEEQELNISVIQGSTLGPILFLFYIKDFYNATTLFSVLFADDTTCLSKGKNLQELLRYRICPNFGHIFDFTQFYQCEKIF
jgi:hypothetical protein